MIHNETLTENYIHLRVDVYFFLFKIYKGFVRENEY